MQPSTEINVALQLAKSVTKTLPQAIKDGMLGKAEQQLARARSKGLSAQEQIDHDHVLELIGSLRPSGLGRFSGAPSPLRTGLILVACVVGLVLILSTVEPNSPRTT